MSLLYSSLLKPLRQRAAWLASSLPSSTKHLAPLLVRCPGLVKALDGLVLEGCQHRLVALLADDLVLPQSQQVLIVPVLDSAG